MPQKDSLKNDADGKAVEFRTARYGVLVYRKVYPRSDGAERPARNWIMRRTISGKTAVFSLGVDQRSAEKKADEIAAFCSIPQNTLAQAVATYNPRQKERGLATIGDCLDTYERARAIIGRRGGAIGESTWKGYRSFLLKLVRRTVAYRDGEKWVPFNGQHHIDFTPWTKLSTDILTAKFVMDFKLATIAVDADGEPITDEEEIQTAKISADTTLRNARAIFAEKALKYFGEVGMKLPDLNGFMKEPDFGAKKYFELLGADVIVGFMRQSLALRASDPEAYKVFLLCMHCGLRAGEAAAFSPDWIQNEDRMMLYVRVKGEFSPKRGKGRKVAIAPWVAAALNEAGPVRGQEPFDRLTAWVRGQLPEGSRIEKPLHELRKCWVSYKAKTEGLLAASQQAGHSDPKVTSTHYADNMLADRLVPFWESSIEKVS